MNCTDFLSKLTDYFDGNIDQELLVEVKQHLCECHHCEVVVDTTRHTIRIYRNHEVYKLEPTLQERLHQAIMAKCSQAKSKH